MELDVTQLASSLGIGGPIVVAAMVLIKRVAEKLVTTQDKLLDVASTQNQAISNVVEQSRQLNNRLERLENKIDNYLLGGRTTNGG